MIVRSSGRIHLFIQPTFRELFVSEMVDNSFWNEALIIIIWRSLLSSWL